MAQPGSEIETQQEAQRSNSSLWIGYVAPMVTFLLLTQLEGWKGLGLPYIWLYMLKMAVVSVLMIAARKVWKDIRFDPKWILPAVLIGVAACAMWIGVDRYTPHLAWLGTRKAFNPYIEIPDANQRVLFMIVRFYGLVAMVPVMEELFWRSFLLRWLTDPDYTRIPMGTFSWSAFGIAGVTFGLAHPEWLAAILFAGLTALLLKQTRSLFACVVVHGVTNLLLGLYVLKTGNWQLW